MKIVRGLLCLFVLLWLVLGTVAGGILYAKFPYPVYFLVPFVLLSLVGLVPGSLLLVLTELRRWYSRVLVVSVYAGVIAVVAVAPGLYRNAFETPRNQGPYLTWSGDPKTSMTVSWTTAAPVASEVLYGPADGEAKTEVTSNSPTQCHHVRVEGLAPGTEYVYRVPALGEGMHSFSTAPEKPEPFSFAVYGDSRPFAGITCHRSVVDAILQEDAASKFRFIINTGDIVENPGPGYGWQWHLFLSQILPLAASRPYLISIGNHEVRETTKHYERYFDYGTKDFWYDLKYGGVHFVFVSTQHETASGSPQYKWLFSTLEQSRDRTRFTVVVFHKPMVTYDPRESYRRGGPRVEFEELFERFGVDLVFAGHVHAYEHHFISGFDHVISGGGGVPLWAEPVPGEETVKTETCFHFCAVSVEDDLMRLRAIRRDGSLIEEFVIRYLPRPGIRKEDRS